MSSPAEPGATTGSWLVDAAVAGLVLTALFCLHPLTPDGDGLYHAGRAVEMGWSDGMVAKHPLYAALLKCVHLSLDAAGLRSWTLEAFALVSCLCGAGLYLVLARGFYPPLLGNVSLSRLGALGTLASYGVMQCCCSIETYAPALFFDAALVTVCLRSDVATPRGGVAAGLLFVLAVGMHATNVLFAPFLLTVLWLRLHGRRWTAASWALATVALGGLLIAVALAGWPPDWRRLVPQGDPEPALGIAGRLGRAVYGWLRTFVWLVPSWELTKVYAIAYAGCYLIFGAVVLALAWRIFSWTARRGLVGLGALLAVPFLALGIKYFPSDPERWLFLVPFVWLILGWVWADHRAHAKSARSRSAALAFLIATVAGLALFNGIYKLWPEARHNRDRTGVLVLAEVVQPGDVIVAPSRMSPVYQEFVVGRPLDVEVVPVDDLMLREHPTDVAAGQKKLRQRVKAHLQNGRRVLVHALLDENLVAGRGYPWAWVEPAGYTPQMILEVLAEFRPEPMIPTTPDQTGTFRLQGP